MVKNSISSRQQQQTDEMKNLTQSQGSTQIAHDAST